MYVAFDVSYRVLYIVQWNGSPIPPDQTLLLRCLPWGFVCSPPTGQCALECLFTECERARAALGAAGESSGDSLLGVDQQQVVAEQEQIQRLIQKLQKVASKPCVAR